MRIILIGTDRKIFDEGSAVRDRLARFGTEYTDSQDSIVFSTKNDGIQASQEIAPRVHAHPTNSRSRFLYGWDALQIAKKLPRPDLISAQDPFETGFAAYLVARHFRVPFIVEVHTDFISPEFVRHSLLNRIRVMIASFVLPRAAGGYAVSKRVRDELVRRYDLKTDFGVFPIYVDLSRFRAFPRTPKAGNLLWVGRFTTEKNPMLALHALAAARAHGHDVYLTMLGSGPLESALRSLADSLHIDEYVSFPGWQDPADFLPETELALATSRYEGYGMAIVEALAAGVPVLSTDVGVAREAGAQIAEGGFSAALLTWLSSRPHTPASLTLASYDSEADYFSAVKRYDESVIQSSPQHS